jgi:hypothetical protein
MEAAEQVAGIIVSRSIIVFPSRLALDSLGSQSPRPHFAATKVEHAQATKRLVEEVLKPKVLMALRVILEAQAGRGPYDSEVAVQSLGVWSVNYGAESLAE